MSQKKSEPPLAQTPPTDKKWEEFKAWRDRPSKPGTDVCCYCGTDNGPAGISRIGGWNCYWCMGN